MSGEIRRLIRTARRSPEPPGSRQTGLTHSNMLHRFAKFVAGCTVLLVLAGSLVTSTGSGLSVPDWPTTYGWNMFTFPPSKWVGGIFYEHGHRLIASTVGCLTIVLAAWLWVSEPRRWLKWLGIGALGAVVAQGVLGGLTVLFYLPAAISTAHAALAEIFFCLVVSIALFTSPGWINAYGRPSAGPAPLDRRLRLLATATTGLVYSQILVGAAMRHTGAGLAIPDFPLMFGHIVPPVWDPKIAVHFAHRIGALLVLAATGTLTTWIAIRLRDRTELRRPAALLAALVAVQVTLGALTVLSHLNVVFNSVHVVCGALVLTTSLVISLRAWRGAFTREWQTRIGSAPAARASSAAGSFGTHAVRPAMDGQRLRLGTDRGTRA
jgi:cytochrome c oxidase assembly protein subunit 15